MQLESYELKGDELSQRDGHVLYIQNIDELESFCKDIFEKKLLSAQRASLLQAIIASHSTTTNFCTIKQVENYIAQSRDGINKSINFFVKAGFIEQIDSKEIMLNVGQIPPRTKFFKFANKNEFLNILNKLKKSVRQKSNSRSPTKDDKKIILSEYNLPSSVLQNNINRGMFPSNLPPFHKMLPSKGYTGNNYITTVKIKDRKVMVDVKSTESIMTDDDLKTLYTLMTLSLNQQANLVDYYVEKQCDPVNSHYIEIRHLMKVLNKSSAGSYYEAFVKSIFRIKDTIFNLHQLESMFVDIVGEEIFASPEFRFFQSCTPISKEGPIVVEHNNTKKVEIKPFGFVIEWNKSLFKKMLTDKYFFVIPLKILSAPTQIFLLYMFLRNQFSYNKKNSLSLSVEDLLLKLNSTSLIANFKRDMKNSLNTWNKELGKLPDHGKIKLDLEGFNVTVHLTDKHITHFVFSIDTQKMLARVGLISNEKGLSSSGKEAAPIVNNSLYDIAPLLSFKENRGSELPSEYNMRLLMNNKNLLKEIEISKTGKDYIVIKKSDLHYQINAYSQDSEILKISEAMQTGPEKEAAFFSHLQTLRNKLNKLSYGQSNLYEQISTEDFGEIQNLLFKHHQVIAESNDLFKFLLSQNLLVKIIAEQWDSQNKEQILTKIHEIYCNELNHQQEFFK